MKGFSDVTILEKITAAAAPNTPWKEDSSGSEPESGTDSEYGTEPAGSVPRDSATSTSDSDTKSGSKSVRLGQGQLPAGSVPMHSATTTSGSNQSSLYDDNFPPLPNKRGGWDVPRGGLYGGQPPRRNLFGLKDEEIKAALEDTPTKGPAPTSAGSPTPVPAATTSAAPSSSAGPPTPVPAATSSAAPSSPSAMLCKHCLDSQYQHKCSQCGLVRCTQFHLDLIDEDKRIYLCQGCDPTVTGTLNLSTLWRMPGLKSPDRKRKRLQRSPEESDPAGPAGPSRADR